MGEEQVGLGGFSSSKNAEVKNDYSEIQLKEGQQVYSHSRLSTFEQCPLKFKFAYIDKLEVETDGTIEAFLGSRVHEVLEKLYTDLKFEKENTLQELLDFYNQEWQKHWTENVIIVREEYNQDHFRKMGERFITDYYKRYHPFRHGKTIGLEMRVIIKLDPQGRYVLQGFIDRLTDAGDGVYEIHDYKTANSLPEQDKLDVDRQLALYSMAVKEKYRDCKKVVLIWHYLAFDKELRSERTDLQLESLRLHTTQIIKEIEAAREFPAKESALCSWCEFRPMCPKWKHMYQVEKLTPEEFKKEDGVKLVDEYAALKKQELELQAKLEKLNVKLMEYAEAMKADRVFGSNDRATIWKKACVKFPGKMDYGYAEIVKAIKDAGQWEEFNTLDKWKLEKSFEEINMNPKLMTDIARFGKKDVVKKIYLSKR
jgi:putative RecB family exonuclease